jgi:microsomal dipeptidase-like Zn-dependent dipeptidase
MKKLARSTTFALLFMVLQGGSESVAGRGNETSQVHHVANRCFVMGATDSLQPEPRMLAISESGEAYAFSKRSASRATRFFLKPSRLGTYLFYDDTGSYLVSDGHALLRASELLSDVLLIDDSYESEAEWVLESVGPENSGLQVAASQNDRVAALGIPRLRLRHRRSGRYLSTQGLVDSEDAAARIKLLRRDGCAEFPEATLDATGRVRRNPLHERSLFGIVDTHSHVLSNFGFGGGGLFHGAPFHPLGIEHALSDCTVYHGVDGRKDLFGFGFDTGGGDPNALLEALILGQTPTPNHDTSGYPEFVDWPSTHDSSTHQTQYYKWLERAYLAGLRLEILHATTNQIICDLIKGTGAQQTRYSCNDMVGVDRIIDEAYNMQDYIDAQEGGPGKGWFRIVTSPAEARRVIRRGKMAVVLGIETSNLFDCFLVPSEEFPACTEQDVVDALDRYHARGVRVIFPVHKYDNTFSAGDGHKQIIELGNFIQTGHFSNYGPECDPDVPATFDKGPAGFSGLNRPRDEYASPPPNDMSGFAANPLGTLLPFLGLLLQPPGTEEVCQRAGLTPLGEFLIEQMMQRGMILELDHMPRRSYKRAFEMLEEHDYPAAGTHGSNNFGKLYALGGVSKSGFRRCRADGVSASVDDGYQARIDLIEANAGYPAEGFGFDLNGFAGGPGPRFGPENVCGDVPQLDPVTYPFQSYAGDITFTQPRLGSRDADFNTEGMAHIGLLPELIEDIRGDGVSDEELAPLFHSAEGYVRMWEKSERRALDLRR